MKPHHSPLETTFNCVRLGGSCRELIERLPELGPMLIQGRNHGGGIGKLAGGLSPIVLDGFSHAYDPGNHLGFSLEELIAVHASARAIDDPRDTDKIDFEFGSFTAGLSLLEISGISEPGSIQRFAGRFGGVPVTPTALQEWRNEIQPPLCVCGACGKAAQERANHPEQSPLYGIFECAARCEVPVHCRILGEHIDLTAEFLPSHFYAIDGYLVIHDWDHQAILHLDLRFVHAFSIKRTHIDAQERATLSVYDMHGNLNFEISSLEPEMAGVWQGICQNFDHFTSSGREG